jgi:hypothetical protein
LVAGVVSAQTYGDSRIGAIRLQSITINSSTTENVGHVHITTSPTSLYRVTFTTSTALAGVQMFDSRGIGHTTTTAEYIATNAALTAGGNKFVKADIGEATASDSHQVTYDPPLRFDNGVLAGFYGIGTGGSGTATIEYRQD